MRLVMGLMMGLVMGLSYGCSGTSDFPRPRGYARIDLPPHGYQALADSFPYFFEYGSTARIEVDSSWMAEPHWIYVHYPDYGASIQVTYKAIGGDRGLLEEILHDTYQLSAKHQVKAYAMQERILWVPVGSVSYMRITGEVPTPVQFHLTDSVRHFFRGALYFETSTKNDSLAPVIEYLNEEILHLLETFEWRSG